ncbi:winged helix-turn-helix domain-containing protein [Streptomyces sp. NPDC091209]|uniref:helix-turn-helix domain-containing protein n=1 Tax=Streptomyces sp. NPDC091209 TaxID=3365974 RepID=UPI003800E8A1
MAGVVIAVAVPVLVRAMPAVPAVRVRVAVTFAVVVTVAEPVVAVWLVRVHLARLRLAGLVTTRKEGRRVVYGLRHGHLRRLVDEALNVADHQIGHLPPHD